MRIILKSYLIPFIFLAFFLLIWGVKWMRFNMRGIWPQPFLLSLVMPLETLPFSKLWTQFLHSINSHPILHAEHPQHHYLKGYYKICWQAAHSILKKNYNFDMIVIHIGILMYPVKDSAERDLFSQNIGFFNFGGNPK